MKTAATEELELIETGNGGGAALPPLDGGGDDGRSGPSPEVSRRAFSTVVQLTMAAIVMFFMSLTSAYIVRKGLGTDWQATPIPPVLWLNTLVLLASSATIELARRKNSGIAATNPRAAELREERFSTWWTITIALGLLFLAGQLFAWRQLAAAGLFLRTNPSSSFFYVLTAAHGAHLIGGIFALFYVAFRNWKRSRITQETAADLAALYWHFMDGLWLFLLALLTLGR
ncbi:MAG: cytochrome c oxidase subunit 3 [Candidatus Acidiferrales bacterium]